MKKGPFVKVLLSVIAVLAASNIVSAACTLNLIMVNQDPYPAVPGDYVKVVFQLKGIESSECQDVTVELIEKYPISFDPGENNVVEVRGGTFQRDFNSYLLIPYKVRLDENALEGENQIELAFGEENSGKKLKTFNIEVEDTYADFEVYIKNYDPSTKIITLEVLNIAEADVEALAIEIPRQETITIIGAKTNIIGDLDSNEYTTADFQAVPEEGEIKLKIYYSDKIGVRRSIEKSVVFEPEYFSVKDEGTPWYVYLIYLAIAGGVVYFFYQRRKKKKSRHHHHKSSARL